MVTGVTGAEVEDPFVALSNGMFHPNGGPGFKLDLKLVQTVLRIGAVHAAHLTALDCGLSGPDPVGAPRLQTIDLDQVLNVPTVPIFALDPGSGVVMGLHGCRKSQAKSQ